MSTHTSPQNVSGRDSSRTASPDAGLLLRRKCACGGTANSLDGECEQCKKKRLQPQLAVGASNDPLEGEAERVADQVVAGPEGATPPSVQRQTVGSPAGMSRAPASVDRALGAPGQPLEPAVRQDMEGRFGHDFARVRVHSGGAAEQSARDVDANAYTVGHDIVFGSGQFAPASNRGRRLLAHELAHVVQQGPGAPILRAQPKKKAPAKTTAKKAPAKPPAPKVPQICGRDSRKVKDNFITKVNIDVGTNELTIEWDDPKKEPALSKGKHNISPGTGKCCVDCNDPTTSQTVGSLCTPKGGTWKVFDKGCALGGHPGAKNPSYFQRAGVAIHSGNTSAPPQSHGCARTAVSISELIHDNVVIDKTDVAVSGTWSSTTCYMTPGTDVLSNRKDVCDGTSLKKKGEKKEKKAAPEKKKEAPAKKAKPKGGGGPASPQAKPAEGKPVAAADELPESDERVATADLGSQTSAAQGFVDGPGPHNEPASEEAGGEMPLAEVDPEGEEESGGEAEV
jgi:hypothetical protein